ncbi:SDR family NAD(P)-dependent oxidoreductase [Streptomyces sp. PRKS01-29]|nr:SDR family NAD(P)-dependent oxidoreductase [Streptomyces sabulosicollis]
MNGPESVVVSGTSEAVAAVVEREPRARRIAVDYASHSPVVQGLREELLTALGPIVPAEGTVPVYSSVTGGQVDGSAMDAEYWYTNLRERVDFHGAVSGLVADGFRIFLEMSPHPVLTTSIEETAETVALGTLRRGEGTLDRLYRALGEAFTHGVSVDWRPAYPGAHLVDLPTYAFQHQHFWVTSPRDRASVTDRWRHRVDWSPLPEPPAVAAPGRWLVLGGATGTAWTDAVVRALGERAVQVSAEAPRAQLAERLRAQPSADGVLLTPGTPVEAAAMLQALDDAGLATPTWIATRAAVAVGPADPQPRVDQTGVWGLGRVAAWEYPVHWGGLIDLPEDLDEPVAARLRSLLAEEKAENQVAIRTTGLYGRRLLRAAPEAPARAWTPEGTVLITGGTGGLGAELARWAAGRGAGHLILLSRRGPDAPGAQELREQCEQAGARVTFVAADVADRERMAAVLDEHPVTSVFHLAASLDDGVLDTLTPDGFATVARAKVRGAQVLDELTRGRGLSAFVLFSSISGVFGVPGLGAYAASNAMLDAVAVARRAAGEHALAVAWGAWAGAGLATHVVGDERLRRMGLTAMPAKAALAALEHALNREDATVAVFDADWDRVPSHTRDGLGTLLHELPEARRPAAVSRPDAADLRTVLTGLDAARRTAKLRDLVRAEVADALGHDDPAAVDPRRAFGELGFDSLTSVRLRNRLTELTGLSMPVTVVFDFSTVAELGEHLAGRLGGEGLNAEELLVRLESLLDEAGPDEVGTLLGGMEALLGSRRPRALATGHFASASDDEMFRFIDRDHT